MKIIGSERSRTFSAAQSIDLFLLPCGHPRTPICLLISEK